MSTKKKGYRIQDTGYRPTACRDAGFTLVELLITMAVFVFVIAAATSLFVPLLTQFKQQSKMAETNIEGVVGLDIMRRDIEHAGYGLPWNGLVAYTEPTPFNDSSNAPRAILSVNSDNSPDYLVIKAVNVATNAASTKSTNLSSTGPRPWMLPDGLTPDPNENLASSDRVIVISPGATTTNSRSLVVSGGAWYTTYGAVSSFQPSDNTDVRIVYGVDSNTALTALKMPFNRADYYINTPTSNMPSRCATGAGILYKATVNQSDGRTTTELPLLDCVTDMQVTYCLDNNGDGVPETNSDDISGLTAQQIREQVKEVRVYIVAHEGQKDATYNFSKNSLSAIEACGTTSRTITLSNFATVVSDYKYYRWKLYTIVVKPMDLGQ